MERKKEGLHFLRKAKLVRNVRAGPGERGEKKRQL